MHKRAIKSNRVLWTLFSVIATITFATISFKSLVSEGWHSNWLRSRAPRGKNGAYVAACAIAKDEQHGIVEWIVYHWALGIHKFYLLDDNSDPPLNEVLQPFIDSGLVHYQYGGRNVNNKRSHHYDKCAKRYKKRHKFMLFSDVDQFLILKTHKNMTDFLRSYDSYDKNACLVIPWRSFSSSGFTMPPPYGILQSYKHCQQLPTSTSITPVPTSPLAQLKFINGVSRHTCEPVAGKLVVDVYGNAVDPQPTKKTLHELHTRNLTDDVAVMYHYPTRSWAEYAWKNKLQLGEMKAKYRRDNKTATEYWVQQEQLSGGEVCSDGVALGIMTMKLIDQMKLSSGINDPRWTKQPEIPKPELSTLGGSSSDSTSSGDADDASTTSATAAIV